MAPHDEQAARLLIECTVSNPNPFDIKDSRVKGADWEGSTAVPNVV